MALDLLFLGALVAPADFLYELINLLAVGVVGETFGRRVGEPLGGAIEAPRGEVEAADRAKAGTPHERYLVEDLPS